MTNVARSSLPRALTVASIGLGVLLPSVARAQTADTIAEALFRKAQERMAAHDVDAACDLFAQSLKVDPALGTLLNLAACHEKQGKTATAWREFSEAEARASRDADTRRAEFARAHMTALDKALPRIVIEIMTPAPGLRVTLDGTDLPREVWGTALPLDPGEHRLDVTGEGRAPFARKINLGPSGGTDRIEVTLAPAALAPSPAPPAPPPLPPPAPPPAKGGAGARIAGWVGIGAGVAGLGAAIGLGVQMGRNVSRRDQLCPPGAPCADQAAFSADHAARVDRLGMLVSGGIGLAALGAGVGLVVVSRRKASPVSRVDVTPWVGAAGAGVGVRGAF